MLRLNEHVVERYFMIACNYDFMSELKSIENIKEISKMLFSAMMSEIPRMDENISFIFEDNIF